MRLFSAIIIAACLLFFCGCEKKTQSQIAPENKKVPSIHTIYSPQGNAPTVGAMYPRVIKIKHHTGSEGKLLATFEHYMNHEPSFSIYESTDDGDSWHLLSEVEDTQNKWGMKYQPHLFELPKQVGEFPAGTIFCSGNSIPKDLAATELLVYASRDGGKSWEYLSSVIKGGRAIYPNKGETPISEPFLGLDKTGRLVTYYADERYEKEKLDQMLANKVSEDGGRTWAKEVFDVAIADGKTQPGMAIVAGLPNGKYIMVFEIVGIDGVPVHYKMSDDGDNWGDPADLGKRILDGEGRSLRSTPFVIWTPHGGPHGTILVSAMGINDKSETNLSSGYMINKNLGEGAWTHLDAPVPYTTGNGHPPGGYSQSMIVLDDTGSELLQIVPVPNENKDNGYQVFAVLPGMTSFENRSDQKHFIKSYYHASIPMLFK